MSVEATALSRSKLEQKDRSELAAIVEAMGGKAGSRAKKADLVELVLELAGASPPPSTTSPPTSPPIEAEHGHANGDAGRAVVAPGPAVEPEPVTDAQTQAPSPDEEPPAEWEMAAA